MTSVTPIAEAPLYPLALKLAGARVLVVGGGTLAFHKAGELLACGARVTVVSPAWKADFSTIADGDRLTRIERSFATPDLDSVSLVVAATDDPDVQEQVARGARERGLLYNVVDVPHLCNFYVPAILRRGPLLVAVSTAGLSPLFAGAVRSLVATLLGPHLGAAVERLGIARGIVRERYPDDIDRRKQALERLLTPSAFSHLVEKRLDLFEAHWRSWESSL